MDSINIFWFRRDLRLDDNMGLYHALIDDQPVLPLFIFDTNILNQLEDRHDPRVSFIHQQIISINNLLKSKGSSLLVKYGAPIEIWKKLIQEYQITKVYTNHDYEPYALDRDKKVASLFNGHGITFNTYKDQVLLEKNEVLKENGDPYVVFTPYSRQWHNTISDKNYDPVPSALLFKNFIKKRFNEPLSLEQIDFKPTRIEIPPASLADTTLKHYEEHRDFPSMDGTSRLGVHLRFGTVSIRKIANDARKKSKVFLNELIWREFYQMILWHFPRVVVENFQTKYNKLNWRNNEKEFEAWCNGQTGYPIVDAGMRELNTTGHMHNRVRMIVASFLTKHLLIDWRWGEAYFAKKLLDYELASNNGGWQWAAGTGVDAAPYFRVFNPELQTKRFDPELKYIRQWVPEFQELNYPRPIVEHKQARERAIQTYKEALDS
ncbi:deoxyribodipyrimidine photo-lyase [Fulvivirga sp. 29W222]|uniref:Deoxyribodipyrimidine photo-lyase n=1 Tax=Fulvivirga marina TaxID=2494733 RepID=A0A937KFA5_9BACT|nr:deoxyribodipyrimidine photo-lyase [Fulvivirga marina]MBL6447993.1 deoxyribodipyrimidine photo-lyase [Fulvivirga marina]